MAVVRIFYTHLGDPNKSAPPRCYRRCRGLLVRADPVLQVPAPGGYNKHLIKKRNNQRVHQGEVNALHVLWFPLLVVMEFIYLFFSPSKRAGNQEGSETASPAS